MQLFEMLIIFEALSGNLVVLACFRHSKSVSLHLALTWIAVLALMTEARAASGPNSYWSNPLHDTWNSLEEDYSIIISKASDDSAHSARLTLLKRGKELSHYAFEGQLISIYWSPGESYVAIDNHYGHRAWRVWILSLKSGSLIRADGHPKPTISLDPKNPSSKMVPYEFYLDYPYLPDVFAFAKAQIISVYPGFRGDEAKRGGGHIGVAYGWKNTNALLMFDSVQLNNLDDQGKRLSILTMLHVTPNGLHLSNASVRETPLDSVEERPPEVVNIFGTD